MDAALHYGAAEKNRQRKSPAVAGVTNSRAGHGRPGNDENLLDSASGVSEEGTCFRDEPSGQGMPDALILATFRADPAANR